MKVNMSFAVAAVAGGILATSAVAGPYRPGHRPSPVLWSHQNNEPPNNPTDSFPFSDNFDSYTAGVSNFPCATASPNCSGPNGWTLWAAAETSTLGMAGPNNASISTLHAASSPNSMALDRPAVDVIQSGNLTSGRWTVHVDTYITSGVNTAASATAYIIILNTYTPPSTFNWSCQFQFDAPTGRIRNANAAAPGNDLAPIIFDQWVPAEIVIDLDADTYTFKYNGATIFGPTVYSTALSTAGVRRVAALDLFSDDAVGVFYDNVSIQPASTPCYANCDGSTIPPILNVNDFICFQTKYAQNDSYANCDASTIPPVLNVNDFICFQTKYAQGCP